MPIKQHRPQGSIWVVAPSSIAGTFVDCRIHRSLRGPWIKSAATSRQECGAAMSRTHSTEGHLQEKRRGRRRSSRQGQHSAVVSGGLVVSRTDDYAAACSKRNSVLWRHMLCSTVASLRATATSAFRPPIRSDKAPPHMETWEGRVERRSMTLAAS